MPSIYHLGLANTSFQYDLRAGAMDTPLKDRLYLLVPISGCGEPFEAGKKISLEPMTIEDFTEDMGWKPDDPETIAELELGHTLPVFDGIAQELTVLRVV